MHRGESLEHVEPGRGGDDPLAPKVVRIGFALHEPGRLAPVDEFDDRVVTEEQRFGEFTDRRRNIGRVTLDRQQQLVVAGGHASIASGLLGEPLEHSQGVPEPCQRPVVLPG